MRGSAKRLSLISDFKCCVDGRLDTRACFQSPARSHFTRCRVPARFIRLILRVGNMQEFFGGLCALVYEPVLPPQRERPLSVQTRAFVAMVLQQ